MKNRISKSLVAASLILTALLSGGYAAPGNPLKDVGGKASVKKKVIHPKTVRIRVSRKGFSPSSISAEVGSPLTLVFTRTDAKNCGDKVVFPSLDITRDLPVGKAVTVKITPRESGEIKFTCGMGMYRGAIVAD